MRGALAPAFASQTDASSPYASASTFFASRPRHFALEREPCRLIVQARQPHARGFLPHAPGQEPRGSRLFASAPRQPSLKVESFCLSTEAVQPQARGFLLLAHRRRSKAWIAGSR